MERKKLHELKAKKASSSRRVLKISLLSIKQRASSEETKENIKILLKHI